MQVRLAAVAAMIFTLTLAMHAGAQLPAKSTATDAAGFGGPGYANYHLGQAVVSRGEMQIRFHSRIEMRAGLWTGEDNQMLRGDLVERQGFGMPRARFGLWGQFADQVPFVIVTDLAANRLTDAWVGYERFKYAKLYFGARTIPFSRSAILSSADAALSERSRSADAMAPFRQIGLTVGGDYDMLGLTWRLGIYNGFDRMANFFQGAVNSSGLNGNQFHGLSGVARLQIQPMGRLGPSVHDLQGGALRLSVGGGAYLNNGGATSGLGYSADLHVKVQGFHLLAEWIRDQADPKDKPTTSATIPASLTRQAISLEMGYVWRKFTVALRGELIDPNLDVDNNDDELWVSAAVGRALMGNLFRVWLQYDHRREMNGQPFDNDSLLFKIMMRY